MCDSVQAANASLLEEHFEEVSFLWSQWRRAKSSVTIALRDLRALEERIESHAQALGVYGQDASGFLRERLANKDPLELWGVAWLWMRQGTPDCGKELVKAFEQCTSPQGRALILEAVARSPDRSVESELQALLAGDEPVGRVQRLQLAAWRQAAGLLARLEPEKLLRHTDQNLQLSAWRNMALCPQGNHAGAYARGCAG